MMKKSEVRQKIKTLKSETLTDTLIEKWSEQAVQRLLVRLQACPDSRISLFLSMPNEIQTGRLIQFLLAEGRHQLLLPRVEGKRIMNFYSYNGDPAELKLSSYQIWEPTAPKEEALVPEIMIMPGVAFDSIGGRVGHGGGFYDTYLSKHQDEIKLTIGFAYHFQVLDHPVPRMDHDVLIQELVTDQEHFIFSTDQKG
ncbi:MAG: 5-formyltetrahydrofolate cyclo-ligase [Porphyromonas sp.]|nr:5-formyltetrahydrofolate cyclo-ligase [Porphyromonas sp.]